ncbi:hypothetical protein KR054_007127, partial [Drosophila jambulina]
SSRRLGLHMKPRRKYSQTIVKSFHISGVAIDEGESAKLYVTNETEKFIVATVSKAIPQAPLDLNFSKGDQITFNTEGDATVSLLGYLHELDSEDEDEDDDDYTIENLLKDSAKQNKNGKKAGAQAEDDDEEEDDDDEDGEEEEEEDDDDSRLIEEYESFLENGDEDDDEDDDEDESGEEEDSDSDEDEDEEEVQQPKAKVAKLSPDANAKKGAKEQNGVAKKEKEAKTPQNQKTKPEAKKEQPKAKDQTPKQQQSAGERTITGGVKILDVVTGKGEEAKPGKRVSVYYIGRLQSNNKTFDSLLKGKGFKFALGGGEVIKGWDVGVAGMKVGGKRRITCPAHMAYGGRGSPPTIPPNSTLVFEVELKAVH